MSQRFFIDIDSPTIELGIENIWPDGDAPENPTAEDVAAVMEKCGGRRRVMDDWGLDIDLRLSVSEPGRGTAVYVK